jgi:hypothetical protein
MVGDVIQNMQWIGYVDPNASEVATMEPYVMYSLDDARKSGAHYAMINLAESYCPGCQTSAGELETDGPSVVQAGGIVIEVLETTGFVMPTQTNLQQWIGKYNLPVTTVKDPDGNTTVTFNTLGGREHAYIVDLTTMKIVQYITGDDFGGGPATGYSASQAMAAMHMLLGK